MKRITLANKKLIAALQNTTDFVFNETNQKQIEKHVTERKDRNIIVSRGWEDEYLHEALKYPLKDYGYPVSLLGVELVELPDKRLYDGIWTHIKSITRVLGIGYHALSCYYPSKGYIGWHHNGNAPGYNIIMTYNPTGEGWFKYYDLKTKKIVTMEDQPGWSVKVGYYGRQDNEQDKIFWHSAYTEVPRLTVSFVTNHREMWNDMIDDIQTP